MPKAKVKVKVIKVKSEPAPTPLVIGFTGHRDCLAAEEHLDFIASLSLAIADRVVWVQGCARGFDTQVKKFGEARGITVQDEPPDLEHYAIPAAFFVRDRLIVDQSDLMVALYDGRETGGTFHTFKYARKQHKVVILLPPQREARE